MFSCTITTIKMSAVHSHCDATTYRYTQNCTTPPVCTFVLEDHVVLAQCYCQKYHVSIRLFYNLSKFEDFYYILHDRVLDLHHQFQPCCGHGNTINNTRECRLRCFLCRTITTSTLLPSSSSRSD